MRKIKITVLLTLFPFLLSSQTAETFSSLRLKVDFSSRYVWRGVEYGNSPVMFTTLGYDFSNFNVFLLGAYSFNNSHREVDCGISYDWNGFVFGLSDYYFPSESGNDDSYFNLRKSTTNHNIESYVTYNSINNAFWITLSTFIYGNDKIIGKQAYSSYLEYGYNFITETDYSISGSLGASLNKSFYNDYKRHFSVVDISFRYLKRIRIGGYSVPISVSYILNPYKNKSFFVTSMSLTK